MCQIGCFFHSATIPTEPKPSVLITTPPLLKAVLHPSWPWILWKEMLHLLARQAVLQSSGQCSTGPSASGS